LIVFSSNRAERGVLLPVIDELKKRQFDVVDAVLPDVWDIPLVWREAEKYLTNVDYVICPFDRAQITAAAMLCHLKKIPYAQMHAGEISSGTFDDSNRYAISLWADMCFCAHWRFARRVKKIKKIAHLPGIVKTVGITHLDNITIDESLVPSEEYNLVIYNPPTLLSAHEIKGELDEILTYAWDRKIIWIGPNGDPGSDIINDYIKRATKWFKNLITYYSNLPRPQFLGLLKNAYCAYGNSSSLIYEAPYFQTPVRMIGERNRIREKLRFRIGASSRIVDLIEWRLKSLDISKC